MNTDSLPVIYKHKKTSISKLNLMYSMPMAELFYENTAGSFLYHEDYNALNKKSQRKQTLYWLFALGLYFVVLTCFQIIQKQM